MALKALKLVFTHSGIVRLSLLQICLRHPGLYHVTDSSAQFVDQSCVVAETVTLSAQLLSPHHLTQ